jgi:hypothetical protein
MIVAPTDILSPATQQQRDQNNVFRNSFSHGSTVFMGWRATKNFCLENDGSMKACKSRVLELTGALREALDTWILFSFSWRVQ